MSYHYLAGQYNDPFKPTRLRNWTIGVNPYPGAFPGCPSTFIADDNGHLLPCVYRNACTSPWGDYRTCIWEKPVASGSVNQLRNPQFYKQQQPCSSEATATPGAPASECSGSADVQVYGSPRSSSYQPPSDADSSIGAATSTCPPPNCCAGAEQEPKSQAQAEPEPCCPVAGPPTTKSVKSPPPLRSPSKSGPTC